ncbi:nucleotidyltransferase domain-containing protein [Streptococcus mutans]|uniref:nucleotidyltransferase domain-containing protein n=1 Tax=Streptococcus mutans TaxID=1309 RepID=UPI0038BCDDC2
MEFTSLWQEFARISEVEAIALGGSRATGNYDETSDYDLYIYCSSIPDEATRLTILKRFCSHIEIGNHFWELEDDCTLMSGQDIDILYRDINQIKDELVDVVERCIIQNAYTTCLWHNVLHSKILYVSGDKLKYIVNRFDINYPQKLKQTILSHHMNLLTGHLPSYDKQIIKAVMRKDIVSFNHRVTAFLETYFDLIFALNMLTHPGEKRMIAYAEQNAQSLPNHFQKNIERLIYGATCHPYKIQDILNDILNELTPLLHDSIG